MCFEIAILNVTKDYNIHNCGAYWINNYVNPLRFAGINHPSTPLQAQAAVATVISSPPPPLPDEPGSAAAASMELAQLMNILALLGTNPPSALSVDVSNNNQHHHHLHQTVECREDGNRTEGAPSMIVRAETRV